MKIEVSDGEVADKYSILCLKEEEIYDPQKREDVLYEKNLLRPHVMLIIEPWILYYQLLHYANRQIWDKTNEIKQPEMKTNSQQYAQLASEIFQWKERRFRMKRILNTNSLVKEQKSYAHKAIYIDIPIPYAIENNKLEELIYLVLDYDHLFVPHPYMPYLSQFIPSCSLSGYEKETNKKKTVSIDQITIPLLSRQQVRPLIHHFTKLHA